VKLVEEHSITAETLWNTDKTGVFMHPGSGRVLARRGPPDIHKDTHGGKHDMPTFIRMTSAAGKVELPMIIFKGVSVRSNVTEDCAITGIKATATENGYMDNVTLLHFLKSWCTTVKQSKAHLILLDSHWSHVDVRISEWCAARNIHLLGFPGNSTCTAATGPGGVCVLKKLYLRQYSTFCSRFPTIKYGKRAFPLVLGSEFYKAFSVANMKSFFRTTGCLPVDLSCMHRQLDKIQGKKSAPITLTAQEDPLGDIAKLLEVRDKSIHLRTQEKRRGVPQVCRARYAGQ